jgi:hypothetical protein
MKQLCALAWCIAAGGPGLETATISDDGHLFIVGDIVPSEGEPGDVSVVGGSLIDPEHLVLIVRNNRDTPVYDINISIWDPESPDQEIIAEFFIPTAGLAPGDWVFGQNAVAAPGLDDLGRLRVGTNASDRPGDFVALDVTSAEVSGDVLIGTVTNSGVDAVGNFSIVSAACFNQSTPTDYVAATLDVERLGPGETAQFRTDPIDPTVCSSFAAYAVGLPEAESTSSPLPSTVSSQGEGDAAPNVAAEASAAPSPPLDTTPASATEQVFADEFMEQGGVLAERADAYVALAAGALADNKLDEASLYAQLAADSYGALGDLAAATPGIETSLGQLTLAAMQTCEQAWSDFSRGVRSFDNAALSAAIDSIVDCQAQIANSNAVLG